MNKGLLMVIIAYLLIGITFIGVGKYFQIKDDKNIINLNESTDADGPYDKRAFIETTELPLRVTVFDENNEAYFYIYDENEYMYLVKMEARVYEQLNPNKKGIYYLDGITDYTPDDIKNIIINIYNADYEDENGNMVQREDKMSLEDFDTYFSNIYLDTAFKITGIVIILYFLSGLAFFVSLILFIIFIVSCVKNRKKEV